MTTNDASSFDDAFCILTGRRPFPWQRALYERLVAGDVPRCCDIPTGLGKTAVVAVWLIAWKERRNQIPCRLVYVVNRRTVVDQTTNEVIKLRNNAFRLGIDELGISTLRGQFADNREWLADPARPAVIVGTVDMIGSRLLFSGYGVGFKSKPLHAAFLGQDALLVHDEAHLEPAFQKLIEAIEHEQRHGERTTGLPWRKLTVMALSATTRDASEPASPESVPLTLTDREKKKPEVIPNPPTEPIHHVWRRLNAKKQLHLHVAGDEKLSERIAKLALEHKASKAAILIYVRTLDDVNAVCNMLKKYGVSPDCVQQLTGTMRGFERDRLVSLSPIFARFLPSSDRPEGIAPVSGTVYLVCTSAGEVGVNISADHMVCDLSTFESMVQRFGRVNRFGDVNSQIDVVFPTEFDEKDRFAPARQATLTLLRQLSGDASPRAIARLDPAARLAAFAPEPTILPLTDILFDAWAFTTVRETMPGRPPVGPYLHGVADWEPPETYVAWRDEVQVITDTLLDRCSPEDLLEDYPLKAHELLRDRSDRILATLQELAKRCPNERVWVINEQGKIAISKLHELTGANAAKKPSKSQLIASIRNCTVLLPPRVGGLTLSGMIDGHAAYSENLRYDVADITDPAAPAGERRLRRWSHGEHDNQPINDMRLVRSIEFDDEEEAETPQTWDWYKANPFEDTRTAEKPVRLGVHTADACERIAEIATALGLPEDLSSALRLAATWHDRGKDRRQFQSLLGNRQYPQVVLAKSGRVAAKLPETYRHEFGSIADVSKDAEFQKLSRDMQDVVLHLIAAHHGRARPHFPRHEAFDPVTTQTEAEVLAAEVLRRFARLQRKYGRWGLAFLESLLRAADYAASANPSQLDGNVETTLEASS